MLRIGASPLSINTWSGFTNVVPYGSCCRFLFSFVALTDWRVAEICLVFHYYHQGGLENRANPNEKANLPKLVLSAMKRAIVVRTRCRNVVQVRC